MSTRVSVWRRSQRSQPSSQPMSQRRAFTLLEVMIATVILAVGMSAALDAIWNNNNFRRNLDETAMAELVLRQMASRLKTTSIFELGHDDARITNWIGLNGLEDGEILWFDLAAVQVDTTVAQRQRLHAVEA